MATSEHVSFKRWHLFFLIGIIIISIGVKLYSLHWPTGLVNINGQELRVLVANTDRHLFQGLSNRDSLGDYDGMLFIFNRREQHTMVMRDMRFPLDMIWIDGEVIVDIAPELAPEPGRTETELTLYPGRAPSTMVLEVPAGFVAKYSLKIGDRVTVAY